MSNLMKRNRALALRVHGLLRHIVQISAEELDTFDIVSPVQLLVDRVGGVSGAAHWQEQNILARSLFEAQCDRDTIFSVSFCGMKEQRVVGNPTFHPHESGQAQRRKLASQLCWQP